MKYSPEEILAIFQEQHRLISPLDFMADENYPLTEDSLIYEWMEAQDLVPWEDLCLALNKEFKINASRREWETAFMPDDVKTIWDVCIFISDRAEKLTFEPITILGKLCLKAGIFYKLKEEMGNKNADVSQLRPSTSITEFLANDKNGSPFLETITLTGLRTIEKFELGENERVKSKKYWIDKFITRIITQRPILTGEIKTFRHLVEKIIENNKLGTTLGYPSS